MADQAAFPSPGVVLDGIRPNKQQGAYEGMSLRDYFAAKALAAMIGNRNKDDYTRGAKGVPVLAGFAYEYADAMLKARAS